MKPVSYQRTPSAVDGGHPNLALDRVLNTSNIMCCEKCGFASTDVDVFKKHMIEHMGTRFYCFYCYKVSFSEAELNEHLKEHTKYPFKCHHCGQGYMRRLCLVKHIDRLHGKSQGQTKPGMTKIPLLSVSSALPSTTTADSSTIRPVVRVTAPTHNSPSVRLNKDEPKGKTSDTNLPIVTNGNTGLLSPINGHIQHNRALTVSLPDEITIPAGCVVELVEVKTVNGTKELKLRLVSQQENGCVIKDARTTFSENTSLGKTLSSKINLPPTAKSTNMGMCSINRKQCETKIVNAESPTVGPVKFSNLVNVNGLKRKSQEFISVDFHTPTPKKLQKSNLNPVRGRNGTITQREPVNHNAAPSTVFSTRVPNRLTSALYPVNMGTAASQKTVDEKKTFVPAHLPNITSKASEIKSNPQAAAAAVKEEHGQMHLEYSVASQMKMAPGNVSQQSLRATSPSLKVPSAAAAQARPTAIFGCNDTATFPVCGAGRQPLHETLSIKTPVVSTCTNLKSPARNQELNVRAGDVPEPEGFPVISSVFSLSQQPEDAQGPIQPLVMALRGIVMDKSKSDSLTQEDIKPTNSMKQENEALASGHSGQVHTENGSFTCDQTLTGLPSDSVKVEMHDKSSQHPQELTKDDVHVKEEENQSALKDNSQYCGTEVTKAVSPVVATATADASQHTPDPNLSLKYLTILLKRIDEEMWSKSQKGLNLGVSKCKIPVGSLSECAVIHPMPLKVNQLVTRPGPNQPVVVLNHPQPRAPMQERAYTVADAGATEEAPKCQILKMRLSKVMGQKYEVMGCTVRVCP